MLTVNAHLPSTYFRMMNTKLTSVLCFESRLLFTHTDTLHEIVLWSTRVFWPWGSHHHHHHHRRCCCGRQRHLHCNRCHHQQLQQLLVDHCRREIFPNILESPVSAVNLLQYIPETFLNSSPNVLGIYVYPVCFLYPWIVTLHYSSCPSVCVFPYWTRGRWQKWRMKFSMSYSALPLGLSPASSFCILFFPPSPSLSLFPYISSSHAASTVPTPGPWRWEKEAALEEEEEEEGKEM